MAFQVTLCTDSARFRCRYFIGFVVHLDISNNYASIRSNLHKCLFQHQLIRWRLLANYRAVECENQCSAIDQRRIKSVHPAALALLQVPTQFSIHFCFVVAEISSFYALPGNGHFLHIFSSYRLMEMLEVIASSPIFCQLSVFSLQISVLLFEFELVNGALSTCMVHVNFPIGRMIIICYLYNH